MPRSTRTLLLLLLISLSTLAWADNPAGLYQIQNYDLPIATADNLFSPLINPSLLGTGWSNGLGWAHLNDNEKWQDHYWFYANMDGLSYVLEHDNGVDYHTFATGSELFEQHVFPNLYAGTSYRWRNSNSGRGDFLSSLTYRPLDAASLAVRLDNPHKASPSYRAGLGIRPLALVNPANDYRLELTADLDYAKDAIGDYTIFKPSLGINTQLLDGIMLGASYNLETESAFLNFSLRSKTNELGTV
ncbi:MAG: signal peptide peptidase SppA, partial [Candidatus Cloacimonadota bacterium]